MKAKPTPATPTQQPLLFVGIDWADQEHVVWWRTSDGRAARQPRTVKQQPEVIAEWIAKLRERFAGHRILIALEQSRGALFGALLGFEELELYPINPKQLASYRDSIHPAGGKSDPSDARLLAEFLGHAREQLRPWQPDDPLTRQIRSLAELRRKLVDERKSLVLRLTSCLKLYFPQLLTLTDRPLSSPLVLDMIRRWPSLQQLKRAQLKTLRQFLANHGIRNEQQQTEFIDSERTALPLTTDQAVIQPQVRYAQALAKQIRGLNGDIAGFEEELQQLTASHEDEQIFRSLPGAGDALAPRLIAAFGTDRDRYDGAHPLQCYSGMAPITKQSGKSRVVRKRIACPTFLRQTFHEFADNARRWSSWSRAFYEMKRSQGMKHHAAVRSLGYKWIRIIYRLWQDRRPYCEATYTARLRATGSPVVSFLPNC